MKEVSEASAATRSGAGSVAGGETVASRVSVTSRQRSEATAARIAALVGKPAADSASERKWDSSTSQAGDAAAGLRALSAASGRGVREAEEFLLDNPDLKGVHSVASVRAQLAKTEQTLTQEDAAAA